MKTLVINLIIVLSIGRVNAIGDNPFSIDDTLTLEDSLCLCEEKRIDLQATNHKNEYVTLSWLDDEQTANDTFLVQKSYGGNIFYDIDETCQSQLKNNKKTYESIDKNPASGQNYYRLVYYNHDGELTYSKIKKIEITTTRHIVIENPIKNELRCENLKEGDMLYFYDANGTLIFEEAYYQHYSRNMSECHNGLYIMSIINREDNFSQTQLLLVAK